MKPIVFAYPGNELLADNICQSLGYEKGQFIMRNFPDGETYIRLESDVKEKNAMIVCSLDRPDSKLMALYFLSEIISDGGAFKITLMAPYLAYMRQDKQFNPGECVTSHHFANFLSTFVDELITIDPHLHRIPSLDKIYSIPTTTLHCAPLIAAWIKENIVNPILIGPDGESKQWVNEIAALAGAQSTVLHKEHFGDAKVKVSVPHIEKYRKTHTPVIVDDIISSGKTMIETLNHLKAEGTLAPVCLGIHAIFAGNAYEQLIKGGASKIVTCNTVTHASNVISLDSMVINALKKLQTVNTEAAI